MYREQRIATLENWSVLLRNDQLVISGTVWDHPDFQNGSTVIIGPFLKFDSDTMSGCSMSGRGWFLENFIPNEIIECEEDVVDFITTNYIGEGHEHLRCG